MAKKHDRPTRRELRQERRREKREAAEAVRVATARRKRLLVLIVLATAAGALAAYQTGLPTFAIGFALLIGAGVFLAVALGGLGGEVRPRDRSRAGNIDYGR